MPDYQAPSLWEALKGMVSPLWESTQVVPPSHRTDNPLGPAKDRVRQANVANREAAMNTPFINPGAAVPEPGPDENPVSAAVLGGVKGVTDTVGGLFTPKNAMIAAGLSGGGPVLGAAAGGYFAYDMGKAATELRPQIAEAWDQGNYYDAARKSVGYLTSLGLAGLSAKHGVENARRIPSVFKEPAFKAGVALDRAAGPETPKVPVTPVAAEAPVEAAAPEAPKTPEPVKPQSAEVTPEEFEQHRADTIPNVPPAADPAPPVRTVEATPDAVPDTAPATDVGSSVANTIEAPPDIPAAPTPLPDPKTITLGSGLGALQPYFEHAALGQIPRRAMRSLSRNLIDYATDGRYQIDEAGGLDMSNPEDLDKSFYVGVRNHPGVMGVATQYIDRLNELKSKLNRTHGSQNLRDAVEAAQYMRVRDSVIPKYIKEMDAYVQGVKNLKANKANLTPEAFDEKMRELEASKPEPYKSPAGDMQATIDKANDWEDRINNDPKLKAAYDEVPQALRDFRERALVETLVKPKWAPWQKGIKSPDEVLQMMQDNPDYISLERYFEDTKYDGDPNLRRSGFSVTEGQADKTTQAMKSGHAAEFADPFSVTARDLQNWVDIGHRNSVLVKLRDIGAKTSDPKTKQETGNGLVRYVGNKGKLAPDEVAFSIVEHGKAQRYAVPKDIGKIITRMDQKDLDVLTKFFQKSNNLFRAWVTARPSFIYSNFLRDAADMTAQSHHNMNFGVNYAKAMVNSFLRGIPDSKMKAIYDDYRGSFASGSGVREAALKQPGKSLMPEERSLPSKVGRGILKVPSKIVHGWEYIGESVELGPREAAYQNSLAAGESPYVAAFRARNITVDFARHGFMTSPFRYLLPFVNARLQGTANMFGSMLEAGKAKTGKPSMSTPKQQRQMFGTLTTIGLATAATVTYNLLAHNKQYANVDPDFRNQNLFVLTGDETEDGKPKTQFTLPTSAFSFITVPITNMVLSMYANHGPEFVKFAQRMFPSLKGSGNDIPAPGVAKTIGSTVSAQSPINFTRNGKFSGAELGYNLMPAMVRGVGTAVSGMNLRTWRPVDEAKAVSTHVKPSENVGIFKPVGPSSLLASKAVNKALVDPLTDEQDIPVRSPQVIQQAIREMLGTFPAELGDTALRGVNKLSGRTIFRDPAAEMNRPGSASNNTIFKSLADRAATALPAPKDNEQADADRKARMEYGTGTYEHSRDSIRAFNLLEQDPEKGAALVRELLTKYKDQSAKTGDTSIVEGFVRSLEREAVNRKINQDIEKENKENGANIPKVSPRDMELRYSSLQVRAKRLYETMEPMLEKGDTETARLLLKEWKIKKLLTERVLDAYMNLRNNGGKLSAQDQQDQDQDNESLTSEPPVQ